MEGFKDTEVDVYNPITKEHKSFLVNSQEQFEGVQFANEIIAQLVEAFNNVHSDYAELNLKVTKFRDSLKNILN